MKNYTITVNGNVYEVTVEENAEASSSPSSSAPAKAAPSHTPRVAPAKAAPAKPASSSTAQPSGEAGSIKVTASVPGKVFKVNSSKGASVKAGDPIVTLEAMKMEIPVVAPQDGTIASIDVAAGDAVENGQVLATMN